MAFLSRKPESNTDKAVRRHSEAVREERTARINDKRMDAGDAPIHCGTTASSNSSGDWVCSKCGDIF